jgi:hypothetical protein
LRLCRGSERFPKTNKCFPKWHQEIDVAIKKQAGKAGETEKSQEGQEERDITGNTIKYPLSVLRTITIQ